MEKSLYVKTRDKITEWLSYEPPTTEVMPYDFNRLKHEIRPGDVLLIQGRSRISSIIRTITQSPWTHAAIYVGRLIDFEDEEMLGKLKTHTDENGHARLIIEDLVDRGTAVTSLNFYRNHHIRICRPIGITPSDLQLVVNNVIDALGHPYSVRHLLDLARFFLPWSILPRRWGSTLFRTASGTPESGVCSTLIAEAYTAVQFPILPFIKPDADLMEVYHRNPYLFTPKDFDYSPYFEIIKYPLFNPDEPLPYYRRMPWAKDMRYQDDGIVSNPEEVKKKRSFFHRNKKEDESQP